MAKELNKAQVNHLRRLLGWVRCEIPPSPDEVVAIVHSIAPAIDSEHAKEKMVEWHRESESVSKYIRAALKALAPVVVESEGETLEAYVTRRQKEQIAGAKALGAPAALKQSKAVTDQRQSGGAPRLNPPPIKTSG